MKKLLAVVLATIMVVGMMTCTAFAGEEGSAEPAFTIGYPAISATNTTMEAMKMNRTTVAEAAGGLLITEDWDFSPEGTVIAVQKLIEKGCDGVIVTPTDESILPSITNMCEDAGVYWCIAMRPIKSEEIKDIVYASDYYLGYVYEDAYQQGYEMGKAIAEDGGKTYALITGSVGDTYGDMEEAGLKVAAEEFGLECVTTVRSLGSTEEATAAIETIFSSYPDVDAVVRAASGIAGDVIAICEAMRNSGKDAKLYTYNTENGIETYFDDVIGATYVSLNEFDSCVAAAILCNYLAGTPLSDEKIEIAIPFTEIANAEELEIQNTYISATTEPLYSVEEVQELMLGVGLESFMDNVVNAFSISEVQSRKTK